jgi:predicted alpha-1,6-mannanase (GH76 family)
MGSGAIIVDSLSEQQRSVPEFDGAMSANTQKCSLVPASTSGANAMGRFPRAAVTIVFLLAALAMLPMRAQARGKAAAEEHAQTQAAADALQQWYVQDSGLYRTTGWWNSANVITTLANLSRVSHSTQYLPVFANTLRVAQTGHDGAAGFLNKYYDDEGWWALAWIDVYDLTGQPEYLRMADSIFADMQLGWDDPVCGGGVWWNKDKKGKNAIENELFLAVAAALANRETDAAKRQSDLAWAHREWTWFLNSGMINGQNLVNDGLNQRDPAHCKNNGRNTWTYNQGVILGALVELNKADPDPSLPRMAHAIAEAAIKRLTDAHGILLESARGQNGGDGPQFKGIFTRNLMQLNSAFPRRRYRKFLVANARSVLAGDRDPANHLGFWWAGPFDRADAARQSSALDVLVGAYAVQ